ncbi:hypothetical protein TNCV_946831 [Trichonephila clavipes]|nr:hypothetical protein TNCV_946831 [Trichonephila clavipes]
MDHVILNYDQVTRTTPEVVPPSPIYHTTPTEGHLRSRQIELASLPYMAGLQRYQARAHYTPATSPSP